MSSNSNGIDPTLIIILIIIGVPLILSLLGVPVMISALIVLGIVLAMAG